MTAGSATKTIGSIFMNDDANGDEIGIRGSGGNLLYNTNGTFRWFGAGIMDKPIRDFYLVDLVRFPQLSPGGTRTFGLETSSSSPYFPYFLSSGQGVTISANDFVIPEPKEYAIVFGLFALAFVIVRLHFQRKKHETV